MQTGRCLVPQAGAFLLPFALVITEHDFWPLFAKFALGLHALGLCSAVHAVMVVRTPQGSVAWALSLICFPYVSLPLFWLFGRRRFLGYSIARRDQDLKVGFLRKQESTENSTLVQGIDLNGVQAWEALAGMRFRGGNTARLCVDGEETFAAIFQAIDGARHYLLIQFYIVRDDGIGRILHRKMLEAAARGVRVYFLFDEIGSYSLPNRYIDELLAAGIEAHGFRTFKGKNRFQINFRNHRKIVVADGEIALVGGHNVGDEYLGKDPSLGFFRDTHVEVRGPAVAQVQVVFMEDWNWTTDSLPLVTWNLAAQASPGRSTLVVPTGPADDLETCGLVYLQAIESAKKRIWIATPYFVPDPAVVSALQLAALRGVEVKILVPSMNDNRVVYFASFSYLPYLLPWGIQMFRYEKGFLHQKVFLVDDEISQVGTANCDIRSFRLNFEVMLLFADRDFNSQVERMLHADFQQATPFSVEDLTARRFPFRFVVQLSRLLAPLL